MRKIILTESQVKFLIGENFVDYLGNKGENAEPNPIGSEQEVFSSDADSKGDYLGHPTLDKASNDFYKNRFGSQVTRISESNSDFKGKELIIPDLIINDLKNALTNATEDNGKIRINTLIKTKKLTPNDAYRILNDVSDIDFNNKSVLPDSLISWIKTQIGGLKNMSKNIKKANKAMGKENAFLKSAPKNKGGKAHSLKTDGISFEFYDD